MIMTGIDLWRNGSNERKKERVYEWERERERNLLGN